jgi:hypothetical protein
MSSPRHRSRHPTVWSQPERRHRSTDEHEIRSRAKSPADGGPAWFSTVAVGGRTATTTSALHCPTSSYETHHCDPADEATPPTGTMPQTAQGPPPRPSGRGDPSGRIRAPRRCPSPTAASHTVAGEERKVDGGKPRRRLVVAASTRLDPAGSASLGAGGRRQPGHHHSPTPPLLLPRIDTTKNHRPTAALLAPVAGLFRR